MEGEKNMTRGAIAWTRSLALVTTCALAPLASAQVYKCEDGSGRTTYSDAPCAKSGKTMKVPDSGSGGLTEGSVCAQLLDERRRLAAEAERQKARGRTESAASIKQREALRQQYEKRCIGIRRSSP
jgi:hypothetical protein